MSKTEIIHEGIVPVIPSFKGKDAISISENHARVTVAAEDWEKNVAKLKTLLHENGACPDDRTCASVVEKWEQFPASAFAADSLVVRSRV